MQEEQSGLKVCRGKDGLLAAKEQEIMFKRESSVSGEAACELTE